jgi:S1-C subfamily serine protease
MLRIWIAAVLLVVVPRELASQALSVLHVKIVLTDSQKNATPVARHVLLISDNPASAAPRRVMTGVDGTVDVRLRPGSYTVESDEPIAFRGKAYSWIRDVAVAAGRDAVLELTGDNAEVGAVSPASPGAAAAVETDPSFLLPQWRNSVVAIWTPTARASGFVIDAKGLVATSRRAIGDVASAEVQLSPTVKVTSTVVAADPERDVAILWINPAAVAAILPIPLECGGASPRRSLADKQEILTIAAPLRLLDNERRMTSGTVLRVGPRALASDFMLASGSTGGPVFTADGGVVGLTTISAETDDRTRGDVPVVRIEEACGVVASAETKMRSAAPPDGTHLPVERGPAFPEDALNAAIKSRVGSLSPYQMSSADFDVSFITPVLVFGAERQAEQAPRERTSLGPPEVRTLLDFGTWGEYVGRSPAVLMVRATPKLVEGFWTTVARGAARTQGVALPPIKHFKDGFSRMRVSCGDAEIPPIHPFTIQQRVSDTDAIAEGFYVFDPGALGPHCGTVTLVLYSEKEPAKADTRVVDPKIVQQIWDDFAPYRALVSRR